MLAFVLILLVLQGLVESYHCPSQCICRLINIQSKWLRVKCVDKLKSISEIDLSNISTLITQLDISKNEIEILEPEQFKNFTNLKLLNLSDNKIAVLNESSFIGLNLLEKLNLTKNRISVVELHTFNHMPKLKKLDLSQNKLGTLENTFFDDLQNIDRLKLNGNSISTLKDGAFDKLKSLKQLDVSNNPWHCDHSLLWFSNWIFNTSIKLTSSPKCVTPANLKGQPIKKLRILSEIHFESVEPLMEILPDQNQVVFAGDSLKIKCRITSLTNSKIDEVNWVWNPNATLEINLSVFKSPETIFSNIKIENVRVDDTGITDSYLNIMQVTEEHTGQWKCKLVSAYGSIWKSINVYVISNQTQYCSLAVTRNNKGVYTWPQTIIGYAAELPCEGIGLSNVAQLPLRATYFCNEFGEWTNLDTSSCPYISTITKILEQFSKVNLSLTKGSLIETLKKFEKYTSDSILTDPVEINFITQTIENYLNFLHEEKELGLILINIVNTLLHLPRQMLRIAENEYKSCSRLVKAIETISTFSPSIQAHKSNLALEEFRIKSDSFAGLTCTWYSGTNSDGSKNRLLHCATNNKSATIGIADKTVEASIQLPASLFQQLDDSSIMYQLMIAMYSNNKLFPLHKKENNMDVFSCIVGSILIGVPVQNLTEPVYVMLKMPLYHHTLRRPKPVIWDSTINETGGWTSDGCYLLNLIGNLIIFHCDRLGYYGILQDSSYFDEIDKRGAKFKYSNPAIYVGSFLLILCLMCTTITYICCYTCIVMPKKSKHSFVNTWIAMIFLCGFFTAGIHQTDNMEICQSVGIILHYLSLCCLLWMTVSASIMYKRLSASDTEAMSDNDSHEPPLKKPVLGIYLVGWGIALIICGITGAINLREYTAFTYCFLNTGPSLAAVFVPATILFFYMAILHLLIRCAIRNIDINGQTAEGTQATENMALELLEPNVPTTADRRSLRSIHTMSSEAEDQEHSQITQLRGQMIVTALYLLTWSLAALNTSNLFASHFPYSEMIFAILYAVSASSLGMFILLFHGIARNDVREQWLKMRCWLQQEKNRCCRTRSVTDANPVVPAQPLMHGVPQPIATSLATQVISDTYSMNSSRHGTEKSHNSCGVSSKGKVTTGTLAKAKECPNPNLVILHRQQYRSNNSVTTYNTDSTPICVEMFYNPHQSGVARKFFKKQRRNIKTNLGPRKQGDGGATSDGGSCVSIPRRPTKLNKVIKENDGSLGKPNKLKPLNGVSNMANHLSDHNGTNSDESNRRLRYVIGQENETKVKHIPDNCNLNQTSNDDYQEQSTSEMDSAQHTAPTSDTPDDSDCKSKFEEEKFLRNVSQQCSLECNSELDSITQIASEKSENNISEISDGVSKTSAPPLSVSDASDIENQSQNLWSTLPLGVHSTSLYSLNSSQPVPVKTRSCHSSMNDIASFSSSKNFDYSRSSKTNASSTASSHLFDLMRDDTPDALDEVNKIVEDNESDTKNNFIHHYFKGLNDFKGLIAFEEPLNIIKNRDAIIQDKKDSEFSEDDDFEDVNKETSV